MYKTDDRFDAPPDDAILWRYMSYTKFVSILTKQAIFFARADKLGDPLEGSLSHLNVALRPVLYSKDLTEDTQRLIGEYIKDLRRFMLISCWHENHDESEAMWKLYSSIEDGVAIRTDFQSLSQSLIGHQDVYIGRVNYIDYDVTFVNEGDSFKPFINKRKSLEHEREVRALILEMPSGGGQFIVGGHPAIYDVGTYHTVDVSKLIKEVVVPPYAGTWFVELLQATAEAFELEAPVRSSSMAVQPIWH